MIRTALEFIQKQLDAYMVEREQDAADYITGNVVELQSVVSPDGTFTAKDTNHITIMLAGLDEERREGKRPHYIPTDDKQYLKLNPPVELDLFVLFIAHKKDYGTALRDLSDVISFFQANPVFDEEKNPSLNATVLEPDKKPWQLIERLVFTLHTLSFEQQNNLWAMLGSKYIPSVVYKMKMITVFETKGKEKTPAVTEMNFTEN
jgi:Pvc16 N-terminal domain